MASSSSHRHRVLRNFVLKHLYEGPQDHSSWWFVGTSAAAVEKALAPPACEGDAGAPDAQNRAEVSTDANGLHDVPFPATTSSTPAVGIRGTSLLEVRRIYYVKVMEARGGENDGSKMEELPAGWLADEMIGHLDVPRRGSTTAGAEPSWTADRLEAMGFEDGSGIISVEDRISVLVRELRWDEDRGGGRECEDEEENAADTTAGRLRSPIPLELLSAIADNRRGYTKGSLVFERDGAEDRSAERENFSRDVYPASPQSIDASSSTSQCFDHGPLQPVGAAPMLPPFSAGIPENLSRSRSATGMPSIEENSVVSCDHDEFALAPPSPDREALRTQSLPAMFGLRRDSLFEDLPYPSGKLVHATFFEHLGSIMQMGLIPSGNRKRSRSLAMSPRGGGVFCASTATDIEGLSRRPDLLIEFDAGDLQGLKVTREKSHTTVAVEGVIPPTAFQVRFRRGQMGKKWDCAFASASSKSSNTVQRSVLSTASSSLSEHAGKYTPYPLISSTQDIYFRNLKFRSKSGSAILSCSRETTAERYPFVDAKR